MGNKFSKKEKEDPAVAKARKEREVINRMKIAAIKEELEGLGVDTEQYLDKENLVIALQEARQKQRDEDEYQNNKSKNNKEKPEAHRQANVQSASPSPGKKKKSAATSSPKRKKPAKKAAGAAPAAKKAATGSGGDAAMQYDLSKFVLKELRTQGAFSHEKIGEKETIEGSIKKGLEKFKGDPVKYVCMTYQADMKNWPADQQQYELYHREGTERLKPETIDKDGWMAVLMHDYQTIPPFPNDEFPKKFRDQYTDNMTYQRSKLHHAKNKPIMPGRGMGVDPPNLKIIGDVDPSDIRQGQVGDCWLLSAISALAEFDGAIKKLFRKTKNLHNLPADGPNVYTLTLWDLATWKEVDVVIDERLAAAANGTGLLASRPSDDGELWACYIEKAISVHCGGWDNITGGQCTHAWAIMTGCKEQYTIKKDDRGKYACHARFNPSTNQWAKHENNPHASGGGCVWRSSWPKVGGGGNSELGLTADELFLRMYAWDQENYIVGCAVSKPSGLRAHKADDGLVDNHAYTVIEAVKNAANTGIDLLKVRNPWGKGEIEDGEFDDDGPGWKKYPQIKKLLKPVVADDGIFWVTRQEFFKFFDIVYLSASNMTAFLED